MSFYIMSGDDCEEATPVPISNTAVKLFSADGSWGIPPARAGHCQANILYLFRSSSVVELSAVNRSVVGSNPTCGAIFMFMEKYSRGTPAKGVGPVNGAMV